MVTRRTALVAMSSALALARADTLGAYQRHGSTGRKIVCLDWQGAETALSLGVVPLALTGKEEFRRVCAIPRSAEAMIDLGPGWAPNAELLQSLRPELLIFPQWPVRYENLRRVADVYVLRSQDRALGRVETLIRQLPEFAARIAAPVPAEAVIASFAGAIGDARRMLGGRFERPVYYVTLQPDGRHVSILTEGSLAQDIMGRIGVGNAWVGNPPAWGIAATGIDALAREPEAHLIFVDEGARSEAAFRNLGRSRLWRSLPAVKAGRISSVPQTYYYGGLATAGRLARAIAASLLGSNGLRPRQAGSAA